MNDATLVACVLVCVVLCNSALATHEEHRGQPQHRSDQAANHHLKHILRRQHHNRAQIGNCDSPSETVLELFSIGTSSLIAFYNSTAQTAVIFSFKSSHTIVLNGGSGDAILIDGNRHTIILLSQIWISSEQNFEEFFQSLGTLKNITQSGQITNDGALHLLNRLALQLGIESHALETFLKASRLLNEGRAILVVIFHKPNHFQTSRGVLGGVLVLKGLIDLFNQNPEELAKSGVNLDLSSIYGAPNGAVALLRSLQNFRNLDLSIITGNSLSNLEILLKIMVELDGNNSGNGVNNVIHIIYDILLLIRGQTDSLDDFIQILLQTSGQDGGVEINGSDIITPIIDDLLKLAETQNRFNNNILDVFIKFLRDLNNNNLFLNGVNISELLLFIQRRDYAGVIDRVVRVFVRLNNVVNLTKSIPRFFTYILRLFSSSRGATVLPNLLPGVNSNELQALGNVNIPQLIQNRQNISQVPIIGQIFTTISNSLGSATNGTQRFWQLLNENGGSQYMGNLSNLFPQFAGRFNNSGGGLTWLSPIQTFANFSALNPFNGLFKPLQSPGQINPPTSTNDFVSRSYSTTEQTETTPPTFNPTAASDTEVSEYRAKNRRHGGQFKGLKKYGNRGKRPEHEGKHYKHEKKNHE